MAFDPPITDPLGRTPISDGMKQMIAAEFAAIPNSRRGAIMFIGTGDGARMFVAARYGDRFKVAAGAGWMVNEKRPSGHISIEYTF